MTATSCLSPSRRTRRLGLAVVCAGTFAFVGTSTIAVAGGPSPTSATSAASVVGLRQGDSGPTVQAVQQKLVGLGYYVAGGADGNFGPGTTAALRVFQQQNGLNPTGVVTENTARYLGLAGGVTPAGVQAPAGAAPAAAAAAPTAAAAPGSFIGLRQGSTGPAVRQLQLAILATGLYLSGGADGTFGSSTHRGVTLVQRVNGLPETGVVDAATARVLGLTGSASSPSAPAPAGTVVQVGSTGAAVQRVQQLLIKSGVTVVGGADGVFGPQTRRSVAAFQKLHGLSVTGSVDAATDAALVKAAGGGTAAPAPSSSYVGLRVGSTGPAVTKLQQAIMATGLVVRGGADGIFGQQTRTAVLVYQRVNGLPQTGIVDESTAKMLGLLTAAPAAGGGAGSGGGSAASGFASYDERGARVVALQKALLRAGISFTRRRRRRVRVGDCRRGDEVPAGPRSAHHGQAGSGHGGRPRPTGAADSGASSGRQCRAAGEARSARAPAGTATRGRRHAAADGSTSASTSGRPRAHPSSPLPVAASPRCTTTDPARCRATV